MFADSETAKSASLRIVASHINQCKHFRKISIYFLWHNILSLNLKHNIAVNMVYGTSILNFSEIEK